MTHFLLYCYFRLAFAVLNSPIVIALLSLLLGGVVAATLSSRYQRKQQVFDLRVQGLKTLLDIQAKWQHTYLTGQERETHESWMQFLTTERYVRVLFPGAQAEATFKTYHDAAAELTKHYGTPIGVEAQARQDRKLANLHLALNDLMKVLVARLGLSE